MSECNTLSCYFEKAFVGYDSSEVVTQDTLRDQFPDKDSYFTFERLEINGVEGIRFKTGFINWSGMDKKVWECAPGTVPFSIWEYAFTNPENTYTYATWQPPKITIRCEETNRLNSATPEISSSY